MDASDLTGEGRVGESRWVMFTDVELILLSAAMRRLDPYALDFEADVARVESLVREIAAERRRRIRQAPPGRCADCGGMTFWTAEPGLARHVLYCERCLHSREEPLPGEWKH